jgi:putative glutamine amidotransferase
MDPVRAVIGITSYLEPARWGAWDTRAVLIHEQYVAAVRAGGGTPVVLPPGEDAEVLDRLDGLILTGGADVDPARYGAAADPTTDRPRTDRDASEATLYLGARERGMPVLGICRGLQVMAVASGGALHQDLPSLGSGSRHREAPGTFTEHGASFTDGSLVSRVLGTTAATVNSSHHQAVADPGSLTVTGWADDGTIEVCEDPSAGFVLGVQWHPEMTGDRRLFTALVGAAAGAQTAGPAR